MLYHLPTTARRGWKQMRSTEWILPLTHEAERRNWPNLPAFELPQEILGTPERPLNIQSYSPFVHIFKARFFVSNSKPIGFWVKRLNATSWLHSPLQRRSHCTKFFPCQIVKMFLFIGSCFDQEFCSEPCCQSEGPAMPPQLLDHVNDCALSNHPCLVKYNVASQFQAVIF